MTRSAWQKAIFHEFSERENSVALCWGEKVEAIIEISPWELKKEKKRKENV